MNKKRVLVKVTSFLAASSIILGLCTGCSSEKKEDDTCVTENDSCNKNELSIEDYLDEDGNYHEIIKVKIVKKVEEYKYNSDGSKSVIIPEGFTYDKHTNTMYMIKVTESIIPNKLINYSDSAKENAKNKVK